MKNNIVILALIAFSLLSGCNNSDKPKSISGVELKLITIHAEPIIKAGDPCTENNKFGFEGGTSYKINGVYYILSTEVFDNPKTAAVRLSVWKSNDGEKFSKQTVIAETNYDWNDSTYRMSPWSPMAVYDDSLNRWSVFSVGYKRKPNATDVWNMSGRIRRYDSNTSGIDGIAGPYSDGEWLDVEKKGDAWEGPAEIVSFFPYKVGNAWMGFYGSNSAPSFIDPLSKPQDKNEAKILFHVGLAKSDSLTGRWERCTDLNPVLMDPEFIENPIVTKVSDSLYMVVYDGANKHAMSYSWSRDGIKWQPEQLLEIPDAPSWMNAMRTPLGMIDEGNNEYTIFFTAFDGINLEKVLPLWHDGFGNVGKLRVKLELK